MFEYNILSSSITCRNISFKCATPLITGSVNYYCEIRLTSIVFSFFRLLSCHYLLMFMKYEHDGIKLYHNAFNVNSSFKCATPLITGSVNYYCEIRLTSIVFYLKQKTIKPFDYCHATTCLFMKYDGIKSNAFNVTSSFLLCFIITPMNNKNFIFLFDNCARKY